MAIGSPVNPYIETVQHPAQHINGSSFRVSVDVAKSCDVDDEET